MSEPQHVLDPQQSPEPTPVHDAPAPRSANGLGLASLILGILAFVGAFIPFINYGSGLIAVIGIVLGAIALSRKGKPKKAAVAGVATSAVALILSIALAVIYTAGFVAAVDSALPHTEKKIVVGDAAAAEPAGEAAAEVGTRESPAALGTTMETTIAGAPQYEVTLGASTLDANALVAGANQFNEPAPAGFQFAVVPVTVTYRGAETGTPWVDLQIEFVSAAGTTHTSADTLAVGPAPTMMDINELYPDASGTGNVVIAVPTADIEKGTWAVSGLFSGDKYYFAAQ